MVTAGQRVRALDFPAAVQAIEQTLQPRTSTQSIGDGFVNGTPECLVSFLAPTSGRVMVSLSAGARANPGTLVTVKYDVREGAGTDGAEFTDFAKNADRWIRFASIDNLGALTAATLYSTQSKTTMVEGLDPGTLYTAVVRYFISQTGGLVQSRQIVVWPVP